MCGPANGSGPSSDQIVVGTRWTEVGLRYTVRDGDHVVAVTETPDAANHVARALRDARDERVGRTLALVNNYGASARARG